MLAHIPPGVSMSGFPDAKVSLVGPSNLLQLGRAVLVATNQVAAQIEIAVIDAIIES